MPVPPNPLSTASLAEAIAREFAVAAAHLRDDGRIAAAQALLTQARYSQVHAIRLRAQAGAERHLAMSRLG